MVGFAARAARRIGGRAHFAAAIASSCLGAFAFAEAPRDEKPWHKAGLMKGATDDFYAPELDLAEAKQLVEKRGLLWAAAEADCAARGEASVDKYLQEVDTATRKFLHNKELYGRDGMMAELEGLFRGEGELVLMLGGKSLGKSFILHKLAEKPEKEKNDLLKQVQNISVEAKLQESLRNWDAAAQLRKEAASVQAQLAAKRPCRVIVYDARHHGADLVAGLIKVFSSDAPSWKKYAGKGAEIAGVLASKAGVDSEATTEFVCGFVDKRLKAVLGDMVAACEYDGVYPCLVVDEANVALVADDKEKKERTLEVLRLLTEYTKQSGRMNVLLASSECAEPYRLSTLGFKSDHFTTQVLMPELSPTDMRELLVKKWHMGPCLAEAFMAVWGGHVWAAAKGVHMLAKGKNVATSFAAIDNKVAFSNDALRGAVYCADAESDLNLEGMGNMLEAIAQHGYAPFRKENDPRVELISKRNVGGVIARGTTAPGVPAEAWQGNHDSLLVATNQAMRMLLSRHLK